MSASAITQYILFTTSTSTQSHRIHIAVAESAVQGRNGKHSVIVGLTTSSYGYDLSRSFVRVERTARTSFPLISLFMQILNLFPVSL